ncbi:MAG: cobalamin biosynthesis protein CobD [Chloroflexi bacterium]|nr:cobalamin biosynthesis protein CobD [Chloroflexota bacterium]
MNLHNWLRPANRGHTLLLALALDWLLGDPPSRLHPVAWLGQWIGLIRRRAPQTSATERFLYGAIAIGGSALALGWAGQRAQRFLRCGQYSWLVEAGVLSLLLSLRGLLHAGAAVANPLEEGDLPAARRQLSWHLVSRDTSSLDDRQVAAATIESLAENTSDSVIAPLFWYAVAGLPGALVYRFLNTADAILGYRDAEREWLGKPAARLDDVANLIPARLTALLMMLAAPLIGGSFGDSWRIWRRDAGKTASPNAGHPMSAAAGALGVELEKLDHYRLGAGLPKPTAGDIRRAQQLVKFSVGIGIAAVIGWNDGKWLAVSREGRTQSGEGKNDPCERSRI